MKRDFSKHFPLVLMTLLLIDAAWLGLVAPGFYQSQIGFLLREFPNWYAAGVFYILYAAGLTIFVVTPQVRQESIWHGVRMAHRSKP